MIDETFRLTPQECYKVLVDRLNEPYPKTIQLVTGPRQVGKTNTLLKLAEQFKEKAIYSAADSPESALSGYWERLWYNIRKIADEKGEAVLLVDEIQHAKDWAKKLKGEWDKVLRFKENIHCIGSGSCALRLKKGSKESLAGRIERLTISHWSALALTKVFGLSKEEAAEQIVMGGGYPGSMVFRKDISRWSAYIRDAIIDPAISHDIFTTTDVRRPALLKQVFALSAASPAQVISLNKLQGQLQDKGALDTLSQYLGLLEENYLIASLDKYAASPIKQRSSPPKIIALSNAFPAVMDPRGVPNKKQHPDRYGMWLENAIIAHCYNSGQKAYYWREKDLEVDVVIEGTWGKWAIEIKSSMFTEKDFKGLFEFTNKFPQFRPLLICDAKDCARAKKMGINAISWVDFLHFGPQKLK